MNWHAIILARMSTAIGAMTAALGCAWLGAFLIPLASMKSISLSDIASLVTFAAVLGLPGAFGAYYGFKLVREKSAANIRRTSGSLAVMGGWSLASCLHETFSESVLEEAATLFALIAGIMLYAAVARGLLRREGITSSGRLVGRGLVFLVSLQVFMTAMGFAMAYTPTEKGYEHAPAMPWAAFGLITSILLAVLVYFATIRALKIGGSHPGFHIPDTNLPQDPPTTAERG